MCLLEYGKFIRCRDEDSKDNQYRRQEEQIAGPLVLEGLEDIEPQYKKQQHAACYHSPYDKRDPVTQSIAYHAKRIMDGRCMGT